MRHFGAALRQLRTQNGWTQKRLAEQLGVTKSVVSYYELSEQAPSAEMLVKMAGVFHVTTDYLLGIKHKERVMCTDDLLPEDIALLQAVADALRKRNPGYSN